MNIEELNVKIEKIERKLEGLKTIYNEHLRDLSIRNQFRKVLNRSQEHRNGSFIVLVVGPVKSGKSTLVNLIADAYVSPTHFLECTVRPSIISCNRDGQDNNSITTYVSMEPDLKVDQFDSIIDCLRGQECIENVQGIKWDTCEISPENIKLKVQLDLHDVAHDETLVTSITTPGGCLLQNDVFIIDMPGFDGAVANMDNNPIYKIIAERADLIIFVQSSNSAISKVANDFLNILKENNNSVPVCLIHNIYESAYWHSEDEKKDVARRQLEYAYQEIRSQGFHIEKDNCYSVNLGKVEDFRKQKYLDASLSAEAEKFKQIEETLHEKVISNRDYMRLNNCFCRTKQNIQILLGLLDKKIVEMKKLEVMYEKVEEAFHKIEVDNTLICKEGDYNISLPLDVVKNMMNGLINISLSGIDEKKKIRTDEARETVNKLITDCEKQLSSILSSDYLYSPLYSIIVQRENERINEINSVILEFGGRIDQINNLDFNSFKQDVRISLDGIVNVEHLVPHLSLWHRHTKDMLAGYLRNVLDILVGRMDPSGNTITSFLELTVMPAIIKKVFSDYQNVMKECSALCMEYLIRSKESILSSLIPDKVVFDDELRAVISLNDDLKTIL